MFGVFLVLHGLVHLLYTAHNGRLFELEAGMVCPDGSRAFSKLVGDQATGLLAGISHALAAVVFVAGGMGVFAQQAWWHSAVVGSAAFSTLIIILFWDGKRQKLSDQGLIAIIINVAILFAVLALRWPDLES